MATFSSIQLLGARAAAGFVTCVERLVDELFGGVVTRKDLYRVWFAKKKS